MNAQTGDLALIGEQLICVDRPRSETCLAVGIVHLSPNDCASGTGHHAGGIEMSLRVKYKVLLPPVILIRLAPAAG